MIDHIQLKNTIATLADIVLREGLSKEFCEKAKEASPIISVESISELKGHFHNTPRESKTYDVLEHGYGGWLSACQFSLFEMIFCVGEPALSFVRDIAWGPYDWTQGNAIEILIRFAADGINSDEIIEEINLNFPHISYEAQLYAIEPLISRLDTNENIRTIFDELMQCAEFEAAYKEVTRS